MQSLHKAETMELVSQPSRKEPLRARAEFPSQGFAVSNIVPIILLSAQKRCMVGDSVCSECGSEQLGMHLLETHHLDPVAYETVPHSGVTSLRAMRRR